MTATPKPDDSLGLRPSELMKSRRPELFSDTIVVDEPLLTPPILEYHLDTLTDRKQEYDFERFCRLLAEKEICPNLLPQTGPTGGGDSKVDTETYPVADAIADTWYEGVGRDASRERWAFAVSAKKKWQAKVESDVEKIAKTKRGYTLIYFITNQFVKDKKRAEVEDRLRKKHAVPVRLLDRTWITRCVFDHDRVQLAVDALHMGTNGMQSRILLGPHDAQRQQELADLEARISDVGRYKGVPYQQVEDCIDAALCARGLGKPRADVDGRFARAEHLAAANGTARQQLRVAYLKAWTAFWWYEDYEGFHMLYDAIESLARNSHEATELDQLTNLWLLLVTGVRGGHIGHEAGKFDARTDVLRAALATAASEQDRPSNALQARTSLLNVDVFLAWGDSLKINHALQELKAVLAEGNRLQNYPLETLTQVVVEMGRIFSDNAEYEGLFEAAQDITAQRKGDAAAGALLLQRGYQQLEAGKHYRAIDLLGRAFQKLAQYEHRGEFVKAQCGLSLAYERSGLLWSARTCMLTALNQSLHEFHEHGHLVSIVLPCLQRMVWLDLKLGLVPTVLCWIEMATYVSHHLVLEKVKLEAYMDERAMQDVVLSTLLLRTELWELKWLDSLPTILDRLGLAHSHMALLYALGYEDFLREEGIIPKTDGSEHVRDLFRKSLEQPGHESFLAPPEFLRGSRVTFKSWVIGCEVAVEADNTLPSVSLAQAVLAALESFLATSLDWKVLPQLPRLSIKLESRDLCAAPRFEFLDTAHGEILHIAHPDQIPMASTQEQHDMQQWLLELVAHVIPKLAIIPNAKEYLLRLARDEAVFGRALGTYGIELFMRNVLGTNPKYCLSGWDLEDAETRFPLKRTEPWADLSSKSTKVEHIPLTPGVGDPPRDLFATDNLKHDSRRVFSLIDSSLWDRAGWHGTVYLYPPDTNTMPVLALGFKNRDVAETIFQRWQVELGRIDTNEALRISIIRGIDRKQPHAYLVSIGSNPERTTGETAVTHFIMVSRDLRMDPADSTNLDGFLRQYDAVKRYIVAPAHLSSSNAILGICPTIGIEKSELCVRPAWTIGENDVDFPVLGACNDPIIPKDVTDPPIKRAKARSAEMKKRGHDV